MWGHPPISDTDRIRITREKETLEPIMQDVLLGAGADLQVALDAWDLSRTSRSATARVNAIIVPLLQTRLEAAGMPVHASRLEGVWCGAYAIIVARRRA